MKILFFIGTLGSGGKERRLLELITFLTAKKSYELIVVTKQSEVQFENFFDLNVKSYQLSSPKLTLTSFREFQQIVGKEKPDIIHSWGNKYTLIAVLSKLFSPKIKIVNSEITSAPPKIDFIEGLICKINFTFSHVILANSFAGLEKYNPPAHKSSVIYNGLNMKRFCNLKDMEEVRCDFRLNKEFTILMVASFSKNKDYKRFFEVGIELSKLRNDFIFLGVGYYQEGAETYFDDCKEVIKNYPNLIAMPGTSEVENLANVADIGVLFSNKEVHGEGISNSIIEYMALGKPVIANDAGGTKEIVRHNQNGLLITEESPKVIAQMIHELLNDPERMRMMGEQSKQRILDDFSLDRMGAEFEAVYNKLMNH